MEFHSCPRNHGRAIPAAAGSVLCAPCIGQLERTLRALPELHRECLHHIQSEPRRRNPTRVSGTRRRDRLNLAAIDARNNIVAILESWSGFAAERLGTERLGSERLGAQPPGAATGIRSVPHLARFLGRHLDWLTAQPPAAEFADEIEELRVELLNAIDPEAADRPAPSTRDCVVDGCPGTIDTSPQQHTGGRSSIGCSSGHSWGIREWLTLRHLMDQRREAAV
ncbi:hypothetical protein ACFVUH_26765 [Kitasatospora sp. NPDC058032]|uniref:hypothetical protein n=1 Tax=unclassified Kitasatospora TaxID=2633591 RepID=UPI0033AA65C8